VLRVKYDAIVVGAGPAGSTVAENVSKKGFKTLLIDRSKRPGKVCGGYIFKEIIDTFKIPEHIIERKLAGTIKYAPDGTCVCVKSGAFHSATVFREAFDTFLAERAAENGAEFWTDAEAIDLIRKDGQINGIVVRKDGEKIDINSDIVIAADGVNSILVQKAGLRTGWKPNQVSIAAQELFTVDKQDIDDFFHIVYSDKIAPVGYGYIIPKSETVLVGVVSLLSSISTNINDYLSEMLKTRLVKETIKDGKKVKYECALIPSDGPIQKTVTAGFLGIGDSVGQTGPYSGGGTHINLPIGVVASEVICNALGNNDVSEQALSEYEKRWRTFVSELMLTEWKIRAHMTSDDMKNKYVEECCSMPLIEGSRIFEKRKIGWL